MQIISAFQIHQGYKAKEPFHSVHSSLVQPLQMLPYDEKDDDWRAHNMNWLELQGMEQIRMKYRRLTKNYRLANGIIDKSDYIIDETNENKDLIDSLSRGNETPSLNELQFYPIIPNVVDLLVGEFLKRNNKVMAYAVDEISRNEKLEKKKELVDQILIQQAQAELAQNLINLGVDLETEEAMQQLSPENIQSLPEVENFMRKSYRNVVEEWCQHTINADTIRFRMPEQESRGFRDSIVANEEYWEIMLLENDYLPRVLDPRFTFAHKSPGKRYVSEGNFAGYIELMTVADVIDTHGYKMTESELRSLESLSPARNTSLLLDMPNDGSYYDITKSYLDNQREGSLQYQRLMAFENTFGPRRAVHTAFDILLEEAEPGSLINRDLLRVTTGYWKSQRKVGHLTKIDEYGVPTIAVVPEDYIITEKPKYDTSFFKDKTKDNITFGEHIDWIWINEVWGGVKIGRNTNVSAVSNKGGGFEPIYLGIGNKKRPDRLPIQLKATNSLYGASLPIEGLICSDRTSVSMGPVDRMKPFQVSYNFVNNQISDILIDEAGTVVVLDQNTLPRHSMGEDWGKNNLAKAFVAMKNFQMLPLDTSLMNTENTTHFNQLQKLDMSQTERLLGRIQLAQYFKMEALSSIGITLERMGTVNQEQTATGTQAAVNNSYAQTERYFTQHSDFLMPRIWELILSAAQYYHSQPNRSNVLSYRNDSGEDIIFQLPETVDILPRDIDVYCTTSFDKKELKRRLEQLALENNTTGATIYDLGKMLTLDTPSEILDALKESEIKFQRQQEQQAKYEQQLEAQLHDQKMQEQQAERAFQASEKQKDREARLMEAQIRAAGYPDTSDDGTDEYLKRLDIIRGQQEYQDTMDFKREQEANKNSLTMDQMNLKREEMQMKREVADKQLEIARENKTEAELEARRKKREQAAKKKKGK